MKISHQDAWVFSGLFANFDLSAAQLEFIIYIYFFLIIIIVKIVLSQPLIALSIIMLSKRVRAHYVTSNPRINQSSPLSLTLTL